MQAIDYATGLQHIGIPTNDMKKTIDFYIDLGFEIAYKTINHNEAVVFFKSKKIIIEAYENNIAVGNSGAVDHIALDVIDIEKVFDILKSKGYKLLDNEIQFLPFWESGVKFFTIEGPNAEKIEFSQKL